VITIIGAGMAGLLAANMLRNHEPVVLERQPSLPNNHHAVLRFRTDDVAQQLRIPFRKVRVFKSCDEPDPIKAAMLYSRKVTGRYEMRSLIDLAPKDRFIAPPDLIDRMARGVTIDLGVHIGSDDCLVSDIIRPIISTMPMEALMDLLGYQGPRPAFLSHPGWTITATIRDCDAFVTRYLACARNLPYRISVTGDQLIIEGVGLDTPDSDIQQGRHNFAIKAANELGIVPAAIDPMSVRFRVSRYAKIGELSAEDRRKAKDFMFWASHEHNVYSLGRFATWRAGLLLDDLVNDIIQIESWISNPSAYDRSKELRK
jgi:hypothetical protein